MAENSMRTSEGLSETKYGVSAIVWGSYTTFKICGSNMAVTRNFIGAIYS